MYKELILLIFKAQVEVGQANNILVYKLTYFGDVYGCYRILYFETAIVPHYLGGNIVDFVFEEHPVHY